MLGALGDELIIPSFPGPQYYISPTHFHQHHSICYKILPIASPKTYIQAQIADRNKVCVAKNKNGVSGTNRVNTNCENEFKNHPTEPGRPKFCFSDTLSQSLFSSAVDYPSTTSYYWPDIAENVTQVFLNAVINFEKRIF